MLILSFNPLPPSPPIFQRTAHDFRLISQVAQDLWEVKDKKIVNLTKQDVSF